jgi:hypothetical protein
LKKAFSSARFTGAAFFVCLFLYLILVEITKSRYRPFSGFGSFKHLQTMRLVLFLVAAALVVLNRILNGRLLKKGANADPAVAVQALFRGAIVSLTLAQMPAVLGLALFFVGGLDLDFYALLFVSLILVFMYFPRLNAWEAYLADRPVSCRL